MKATRQMIGNIPAWERTTSQAVILPRSGPQIAGRYITVTPAPNKRLDAAPVFWANASDAETIAKKVNGSLGKSGSVPGDLAGKIKTAARSFTPGAFFHFQIEVRLAGYSRPDLLTLSSSDFDPKRKSRLAFLLSLGVKVSEQPMNA